VSNKKQKARVTSHSDSHAVDVSSCMAKKVTILNKDFLDFSKLMLAFLAFM
jgi:hypothetical protein